MALSTIHYRSVPFLNDLFYLLSISSSTVLTGIPDFALISDTVIPLLLIFLTKTGKGSPISIKWLSGSKNLIVLCPHGSSCNLCRKDIPASSRALQILSISLSSKYNSKRFESLSVFNCLLIK